MLFFSFFTAGKPVFSNFLAAYWDIYKSIWRFYFMNVLGILMAHGKRDLSGGLITLNLVPPKEHRPRQKPASGQNVDTPTARPRATHSTADERHVRVATRLPV